MLHFIAAVLIWAGAIVAALVVVLAVLAMVAAVAPAIAATIVTLAVIGCVFFGIAKASSIKLS